MARLNNERYRKLLDIETDPKKRETLLHLLAEEEAKLAALDDPPENGDRPKPKS